MSEKEKIQHQPESISAKEKLYEVILYNDDIHTFDYVIESLVEICGHTILQAEQCTLLVHYKGKASVSHGTYEEVEEKCSKLLSKGLTAEIL